jgi:hypothetical protein
MAAYVLVVEALEDAVARGATRLVVDASQEGSRLAVTVDDDGSPRTSSMVAVADRVGAVGGALEVEATSLRADMPCA